MSNPFDDPDGSFIVLINAEGQYSLWPVFSDIPNGWTKKFGPASKDLCVKYVDENWVDMRPKSLIAASSMQIGRN